MRPILVVHSEPENVRRVLEPRFPGAPIAYAARPEEVVPMLQADNPEIVFSIKHDDFPDAAHRPLVEHPSVKWIHVGGSGFEHIEPWDPERILVTNSVGLLAPHLAETVTGAILALNGHFVRYVDQQRQRLWNRIPFRSLAGQTLLVVGLGHIGAVVAGNARALGMQVVATRRSGRPHPAADEVHPPEALPELLARADVVSLHVRLNDETRHLIDARALAKMKRGALLVNTSRGPVVDETALIGALRDGHIAGVYLDVYEMEPLPESSPLWTLPNVLLTPHTADNVVGWDAMFAELFADNLERWLAGDPMVNVVSG